MAAAGRDHVLLGRCSIAGRLDFRASVCSPLLGVSDQHSPAGNARQRLMHVSEGSNKPGMSPARSPDSRKRLENVASSSSPAGLCKPLVRKDGWGSEYQISYNFSGRLSRAQLGRNNVRCAFPAPPKWYRHPNLNLTPDLTSAS